MLNIHHLELFYYVAKFGGISAAVRNMPYGIQQPAVSGQILQLEENLGVTLFERQPFRLTREGEELLAFIKPFFDEVENVGERLRQNFAPQLRIGAAEPVLREHVPTVIARMKESHPGFRLALRSGFQAEFELWLEKREIDLVVAPLRRTTPPHCRTLPLLTLPLVLLAPRGSKIKSATELWARGRIAEPLIQLPPTEPVAELFHRELKRRKVTWAVTTEASSLELITEYVANGAGFGVSVNLPALVKHRGVRVLPLDGFAPLELGAIWRGELTPLLRLALQHIRNYVRETWPNDAITTPAGEPAGK
ncbi:MAG TPA: LysR family transcriptional regulator [Opitutaceae bacterium]|nr:LysR family transcriptional regulator [Opitutaceae bacterium]